MRSRFSTAGCVVLLATILMAPLRVAAASGALYGFPPVTSYGGDQIGADPAGYCAIQGSDGVLYFGGNGLLTYDGDRWSMASGQGINGIYGLDFGRDGRIWAATEGDMGWFDHDESGRWTFHSLRPFIPATAALHGQVWGTIADGGGAYFLSGDRLYHWDGAAIQSWPLPEMRPRFLIRFKGQISVQDFRHGLYQLRHDTMELVQPEEVGATEPAVVLWSDPRANRWIYQTADTTALVTPQGQIRFPDETAALLRAGNIIGSVELPAERFVFNCYNSGLVVTTRDGQVEQRIPFGEGIPGYVHALFVDREGLLWAVSHLGIRHIDLSKTTRIFDERADLTPTPCREIVAAGNTVTIGSMEGALTLTPDRRHFAKLDLGRNLHVMGASGNGVLVGTMTDIWLHDQDGTTLLAALPKSKQTAIPSQFHPGEILAAMYDMTVDSIGRAHPPRRLVEGLPVVGASLAEDDGDLLWIGTDTHGIFLARLDPARAVPATPVPATYGLPGLNGTVYVRRTPGGDILVVADNGAWAKPRGATAFAPIRDFPARPFTAGTQPLADGSTWVAVGASGSLAPCVGRLSPDGGWHWSPHEIPGMDLIGPPRAFAAHLSEAGETVLWIGGSKSVLRHVVEHGPSATAPPAPLLRAYTLNRRDERRPITSGIPYSTHAIEFELAEPAFATRGEIHLQTKITGIDPDWVPVNKDSRRELTAIRDGRYVLQARAVAGTGMVSEPTTFTFAVLPPWWRTRTALWLEAAALIGLVFGGIQWRVRALRRRNEQLEQKVKERTEELAEASAAKTQFVANMSHDIRNPLNGIIGLTLALEDTPLDSQQRELIATLRECTSYLSTLVDDVLDFASIEAGRIELRSAPFSPSELLNSVVTTLKAECSARNAFVTIEADPEIPPVLQGDAGRIQQILVNYVSNALKYAGGHIRLSATVSADAPGEVEFAVSDEGPGVSVEEQATLFSKFTRLDAARRSQIPGTGLGLASCRLLADVMGGAVGVQSELGHGSRFFLRLPLVAATEPMVAAPDNLKLPPTSVLLVEDTDYNALAAKAVLAKLGLTCDRAATGAEAIKLFAERRHHIVLLDRNLPDMDGTEVAARLREIETDGLHAVLLAVTAYCTAEDRKRCLDAGMDAFLGKPLTPQKLRRVLLLAANQVVGSAEMASAAAATLASAPVKVDLTLLEYLAEGTEGGVATQIERFISELSAAHAHLRETGKADLSVVGDAAHRVLGHARMIGATRLGESLIELEGAARKCDRAAVDALRPAVDAAIAEITAALLRHPAAQKA